MESWRIGSLVMASRKQSVDSLFIVLCSGLKLFGWFFFLVTSNAPGSMDTILEIKWYKKREVFNYVKPYLSLTMSVYEDKSSLMRWSYTSFQLYLPIVRCLRNEMII